MPKLKNATRRLTSLAWSVFRIAHAPRCRSQQAMTALFTSNPSNHEEAAAMAKVVYNACFGGFGLSEAAIRRYAELKGITLYPEGEYLNVTLYDHDLERDDPVLVQVVEELGDKANGMCAKLRIEEMPDGTPYRIDEYDGSETVITASAQAWRIAGAKR